MYNVKLTLTAWENVELMTAGRISGSAEIVF